MSWRFRKSVKIAPGTRVNFSKSGVSVTNRVGKTGLYHRTQLAGGKKRSSKSGGSGCLGSVWGIAALLFVGAAFVVSVFKAAAQTPAVAVALAVVAVVALVVFFVAKRPGREAAESVTPGATNAKGGEWSFVLAGNLDPDKQQELRELKISSNAYGVKATLALVEENGGFSVKLGEMVLGTLQAEDATWAAAHFDEIEKLRSVFIYGGDRDVEDNPRPLTVKVWADLKPGMTGPQFTDVDLPDPQIKTFYAKGDTVVYVSSTGKIHLGYGCGVNISKFKPMLYQDALDAGCEECSKCFR